MANGCAIFAEAWTVCPVRDLVICQVNGSLRVQAEKNCFAA